MAKSGGSFETTWAMASAAHRLIAWVLAFMVVMWALAIAMKVQPWRFGLCGGQERREMRDNVFFF